MEKHKKTIIQYIHDENRNDAVSYTLDVLKKKEIDVITLYQDILREALYTIDCDLSPEECIWKEHVQTAIVRTIIEVSFPFVMEEMEKVPDNGKKVLVVCPSEEYHEVGAKMVHDFFLIAGFEAIFVGANTPTEEVVSAIKYVKPDYLALSVTNFYNIIKARQIVEEALAVDESLQIVIGGSAFLDESKRNQIPHHHYLTSFESIQKLGKE